jgi:hypothetical protein
MVPHLDHRSERQPLQCIYFPELSSGAICGASAHMIRRMPEGMVLGRQGDGIVAAA